jgi:hypothetical protein
VNVLRSVVDTDGEVSLDLEGERDGDLDEGGDRGNGERGPGGDDGPDECELIERERERERLAL